MYTNICPSCGFGKAEIVNKNSITKSINDSLADKLSFLDYPQLYVTIIFRLVILLITIFLIPDFIGNSEFFWMVVGIFSVYGLIKEVVKVIQDLELFLGYQNFYFLLFSVWDSVI